VTILLVRGSPSECALVIRRKDADEKVLALRNRPRQRTRPQVALAGIETAESNQVGAAANSLERVREMLEVRARIGLGCAETAR
jgi:hypothetical protein